MACASERSIEDGALYLVEERLNTFKETNWPFDSGSCTAEKMAEAGFYHCGNPGTPDWTRCIVCHTDVDGWEATDDPLMEHKKLSPKCAFLKIKDPYAITVGDSLDLERTAIRNYIAMESAKLESDMESHASEVKENMSKLKMAS